jgi:hypothetical protein
MRRFPAVLAASTALAVLPAGAGAKVIEIGQTANPFMPSCPATPCFAVSRTTGYQAKVGTDRGLMTVPANGRIVAWTISLSKPSAAQISFFNAKLGGASQAGLSVLTVGKHLNDTVRLAGPLTLLEPYFGGTAQFPLATSLPVRKGDLLALTVPSWAPALQVNLANDTSWRASRLRSTCKNNTTQTAQLQVGAKTQYYCLYSGARLTYSATLITNPPQTNPAKKTTTTTTTTTTPKG